MVDTSQVSHPMWCWRIYWNLGKEPGQHSQWSQDLLWTSIKWHLSVKNLKTHSEPPHIPNFLYHQYFPANPPSAVSVSYLTQWMWVFIHKNGQEPLFTDRMLRKPRKSVVVNSNKCGKWLTTLWEGHHIVRRSTRIVPSGWILGIWEDDKTEVKAWR